MLEKFGLRDETVADEVVLVTGAEGCIGAWAVRNLALAGVKVVSTDLAPFGFRLGKILNVEDHPGIAYEQADLRHPDVLPKLIQRHGVTRVIHLGAMQVPFVYADPVLGAEVNVLGTLHVLEAARASAGQVRGLVYASSAASVGPVDALHMPETLYGVYKLNNEHVARIYARDYGVPSIGLRPCIVYGPTRDQGLTSALTTALKAVALGLEYRVPFGGLVDVQFAEDVAAAFIRAAMLDDYEGADVYDLHGDALTVTDYLAAVAEVEPRAAALLSASPEQIPGNVVVDDADLIARLGELPKTPASEAIRLTLDFFAAHRERGLLEPAEIAGR